MRFAILVLVAGAAPWAASARGGLSVNGPKLDMYEVVKEVSPSKGSATIRGPAVQTKSVSHSVCALPTEAYEQLQLESKGTDPCTYLKLTGKRCSDTPSDYDNCKTYDLKTAWFSPQAPVVYCADFDTKSVNCSAPDFDGGWNETMRLPSPSDLDYSTITYLWSCKGISGNVQMPCCPGYDCPAWPTAEPTTQPTTSSANAHHAVLATGVLLTALLI
jgi:hypothetical protein